MGTARKIFNLICNSSVKVEFRSFDSIPRDRGGGVRLGDVRTYFFYSVAAFMILFNLICNTTMF